MPVTEGLAEAVGGAVADLELAGYDLSFEPLDDGGAIVTVHSFAFGERWNPATADLLFELPYNYPHAAIYPYFGPPELARADGGPRPAALQSVAWRGAQRSQISLRHSHWDPRHDNAEGAVAMVQRWFHSDQW